MLLWLQTQYSTFGYTPHWKPIEGNDRVTQTLRKNVSESLKYPGHILSLGKNQSRILEGDRARRGSVRFGHVREKTIPSGSFTRFLWLRIHPKPPESPTG